MNLSTVRIIRILPLIIPFVLIASLVLLIQSSYFSISPDLLSKAITIDILVIVPLVYFLIIRKRDIPKITVLSMFILGLVVLSYSLPEENQGLLDMVKTYFLPILELGIISLVIYKVVQLTRSYQSQDRSSNDFYTILKEASEEVFPKKVASVLVTEISVVYYGFLKWRSKKLEKNEFSYHKKNALISITAGLTLVIVGETVGLHSWLVQWNPIVGWIITFLSAYTALQFFALTKSILYRPILIDNQSKLIHLRYGYFTDLSLTIDQIESIELNSKDLPEDKSVIPFSPLGSIGEHNIIIHFKEELRFSGIYGIPRNAKAISIFVDEKERFRKMVLNLNQTEYADKHPDLG